MSDAKSVTMMGTFEDLYDLIERFDSREVSSRRIAMVKTKLDEARLWLADAISHQDSWEKSEKTGVTQ